MIRKLRNWAAIAALAVGVLGTTSSVDAAFTITLHSSDAGVADLVISDNGGSDSNLTANEIAVNGVNFGGFLISTVSATRNGTGSDALGFVDVSNLTVRNISAGTTTLSLTYSATDFTKPTGGSTTPLALEDQVSVNGSNNPFTVTSSATGQGVGSGGTSGTTGTATITQSPSQGDATNFSSFIVGATTYSLTKVLTVRMSQDATQDSSGAYIGTSLNVSGHVNARANAVPAPSALVLGLSGLACGSPFLWLRRRKAAPAVA